MNVLSVDTCRCNFILLSFVCMNIIISRDLIPFPVVFPVGQATGI